MGKGPGWSKLAKILTKYLVSGSNVANASQFWLLTLFMYRTSRFLLEEHDIANEGIPSLYQLNKLITYSFISTETSIPLCKYVV